MDKLIAVLFGVALVFFAVLLFAFLFAIITQYAWNNSIAGIFHVSQIDFWQAFWLNVLGGMVCKSSSGSKSN